MGSSSWPVWEILTYRASALERPLSQSHGAHGASSKPIRYLHKSCRASGWDWTSQKSPGALRNKIYWSLILKLTFSWSFKLKPVGQGTRRLSFDRCPGSLRNPNISQFDEISSNHMGDPFGPRSPGALHIKINIYRSFILNDTFFMELQA